MPVRRLQPGRFMRAVRERRGSGMGSGGGGGALAGRPACRRAPRERGRWGGAGSFQSRRSSLGSDLIDQRFLNKLGSPRDAASGTGAQSPASCATRSRKAPRSVSAKSARAVALARFSIHVLVVAGNLVAHGFSWVERKPFTKIAIDDGLKRVLGKVVLKTVQIKHLDLNSVSPKSRQESASVLPHDKTRSRVVVRAIAV